MRRKVLEEAGESGKLGHREELAREEAVCGRVDLDRKTALGDGAAQKVVWQLVIRLPMSSRLDVQYLSWSVTLAVWEVYRFSHQLPFGEPYALPTRSSWIGYVSHS